MALCKSLASADKQVKTSANASGLPTGSETDCGLWQTHLYFRQPRLVCMPLATNCAEARAVFARIDDALGQNLSELMFNGPEAELTLTENAQPALMGVLSLF